jgi:hypothetical protein
MSPSAAAAAVAPSSVESCPAGVPVVVVDGLRRVRAYVLDGTLYVARAKTPAATARRVAAALDRLACSNYTPE